mgnify:CR=1 FL=1
MASHIQKVGREANCSYCMSAVNGLVAPQQYPSNLDIVDEPRAAQAAGGKRYQRNADAFRNGQVGLLPHCNIIGFPARCGQRRNCGVFQLDRIGFAVADGMIVWSQTRAPSQMGELEIVTTYGAYKDFGGVKRATTTTRLPGASSGQSPRRLS